MKEKIWTWAVVLCLGLCMAALYPQGQSVVRAKEVSAQQAGKQLSAWEPVSHGNMVYWDGAEKAGIYAADFSLLWKKLSVISGEVFDPACYAHLYKNVSKNGMGDNIAYESAAMKPADAVEEKTVTAMQMELPENGEEEKEISGPEEASVIIEGETAVLEPEELWETVEEKTEMSETEEPPKISVSGNDCPVEKTQITMEEETEETTDEGGENK